MHIFFKLLTYSYLQTLALPLLLSYSPSLLWKEELDQGSSLTEVTTNALLALGQKDPVFFGDLAPRLLEKGFLQYSQAFSQNNPSLISFILQKFETQRETGFREGILHTAPLMPENLQIEVSQRELRFLLANSPKESQKRKQEIQLWIRFTQTLPYKKEAFLMLYEKTRNPIVRYMLQQALQSN